MLTVVEEARVPIPLSKNAASSRWHSSTIQYSTEAGTTLGSLVQYSAANKMERSEFGLDLFRVVWIFSCFVLGDRALTLTLLYFSILLF